MNDTNNKGKNGRKMSSLNRNQRKARKKSNQDRAVTGFNRGRWFKVKWNKTRNGRKAKGTKKWINTTYKE